jgi:hypothetical protein
VCLRTDMGVIAQLSLPVSSFIGKRPHEMGLSLEGKSSPASKDDGRRPQGPFDVADGTRGNVHSLIDAPRQTLV